MHLKHPASGTPFFKKEQLVRPKPQGNHPGNPSGCRRAVVKTTTPFFPPSLGGDRISNLSEKISD
jgi:hypothetical protein